MKLTSNELKQIIREELGKLLKEEEDYGDNFDTLVAINDNDAPAYKRNLFVGTGLEEFINYVEDDEPSKEEALKMLMYYYEGDPDEPNYGFDFEMNKPNDYFRPHSADIEKLVKGMIVDLGGTIDSGEEEMEDDEYEIIDPADNMQGMTGGDPMSGVGGYSQL
tara:strand:+ start:82 stop:570 length:489 start_codon:yes stop_codon:yes gene_type:complete